MRLPKVPFKCPCCKWQGIYVTLIRWNIIQLPCVHCGTQVQTQEPVRDEPAMVIDVNVVDEILERELELFYAARGM